MYLSDLPSTLNGPWEGLHWVKYQTPTPRNQGIASVNNLWPYFMSSTGSYHRRTFQSWAAVVSGMYTLPKLSPVATGLRQSIHAWNPSSPWLQWLVKHPRWPMSWVTLSLVSNTNTNKPRDCMFLLSLTIYHVLLTLAEQNSAALTIVHKKVSLTCSLRVDWLSFIDCEGKCYLILW